jgi:hypothetical protein
MQIRGFVLVKQGSKIRKDKDRTKIYYALKAYNTLLVAYSLIILVIRIIRRLMFPFPFLACYLILILSPYHIISTTILSKITLSKRLVLSLANPKKLIRPQRT